MSANEKRSRRLRVGILCLAATILLIAVLGIVLLQTAPGKSVAQWHGENPDATLVKRVNINTAAVEDLLLLEGMTSRQAQRIVEYRTRFVRFASIEELTFVSGISEEDVARWEPYLTV